MTGRRCGSTAGPKRRRRGCRNHDRGGHGGWRWIRRGQSIRPAQKPSLPCRLARCWCSPRCSFRQRDHDRSG